MARTGAKRRSPDRSTGAVCPAAAPSCLSRFLADSTAAVAALYALALFVLVGMAGVAWDWTRMTAMDSELQNAADQAALAAATQLDGQDGAIDRATDAANALVNNITRMSDDGSGAALTVETITFYDGYDQANDAFGSETDVDTEAGAVRVRIAPREAMYTLTPVVGIFSSGDISAEAAAALGSAICNTPPVMICNPFEKTANEDWDADDYKGRGLRLITGSPGVPGNFGFLSSGLGNGANELAKALGYDTPPGECVPGQGVETEPGLNQSVFAAFLTRFDISENGNSTCPGNGNCSAAPIVRKDLMKKGNGNGNCGTNGNNGWQQPPEGERYAPPSDTLLNPDQIDDIAAMGLPRDTCHAWSMNGICPLGLIGNRTWDRAAYFAVNFGVDPANVANFMQTNLGKTDPTRFEVYEWEVAHPDAGEQELKSGGQTAFARGGQCRPVGSPQRRLITAAVINCEAEGVKGRVSGVHVQQWIELFLVEPPFDRENNSGNTLTSKSDIYVEIVRAVDAGDDGDSATVVRRDIPYLIR